MNLVKILANHKEENFMRMARNVYHRKDGRFEARYVSGFDENGKKQYRSVFAKTYGEVKEKLERIQPQIACAVSPPKQSVTVVETVVTYLGMLKHQIKPSTMDVYRRYLDKRITPYFGDTPRESLSPEVMQGFTDGMIENGVSVVTVQSVFSFLSSALKAADIAVPSVRLPKKQGGTVEYLSLDEQKRLEAAAQASDTIDRLSVMLTLYTGIRIGELCGLQWIDIDFEGKTLRVRRTMQRIRSNGANKTELALLPPKSETSTRSIPLPDFIAAILIDSKKFANGEYVLSRNGRPVEPRNVQWRFKKLLVGANIRNVNFHTTRHTFATRALENGFDVKTLSEILGHGSATITLNKYAHATDEHKRGCMNGLSAVFSGV
jgi:integrase